MTQTSAVGAAAATDAVRSIDAGAVPERFARGWHCLGLAADFHDGKPHAVNAFGTKLVVFATDDGALNVLDGYCRHMGGDLYPGHDQGRRDRLPVPRLAVVGSRALCRHPVRQARAATRAYPCVDDDGEERPTLRLERPGEQPAAARSRDPGYRGRRLRRLERLGLDDAADRRFELPRDHRQRLGHGALLLHPLRLPDLLQERLRGPRRDAVHAIARTSGRRHWRPVLG